MARVFQRGFFLNLLTVIILSPADCLEGYEKDLHSLLSPSLRHYDTLHPHHITHTLHGDHTHQSHARRVQFHTLGRDFKLYLKPASHLFSPGFKVQTTNEQGHLEYHEIDRNQYYHGFLGGETRSVASLHVSTDGTLTGSIKTPSEVFHLEPSNNFLGNKPHPPHTIAYKSSDVKSRFSGIKVDSVVAPPLPPEVLNAANGRGIPTEMHQRARRQLPGQIGGDSCSLVLVADHRFYGSFSQRGQDSASAIAGITRRLVSLVSDIDATIYRDTVWIVDPLNNVTVTKLGLEISKIIVHQAANDDAFSTNPKEYYNSNVCCKDVPPKGSTSLDASNLLNAFNFGDWGKYCLAHLFTNVNFPSGLLGLANIASSFRSQTGGICSKGFTDSDTNKPIIYNTGLSSFTSGKKPLIRKEQILVTAHEFGHNWGSHHDPGNRPNCTRIYLMNEFAQDGSKTSHMQFSECSRTSIGIVLGSKGSCFQDISSCGNFLVDAGESCDEGRGGGACCDDECKLKSPAVCSDSNQHCCVNCSMARAGLTCRDVGTLTSNCSIDVTCNGTSFNCPDINTDGMAVNGTECLGGVCQPHPDNPSLTQCVTICLAQGLTRCTCSSDEEQCHFCCQDNQGSCRPAERNGSAVFFPTGTTCRRGSCVGGKCLANQDTISRIFSIITNLDINDFVLFVRENIVGYTLIFTVILWVPASLLLYCCYDRKVWRRFKSDYTDHVEMKMTWAKLLPLVEEYGVVERRSVSPVDNQDPPPYSRRLHTISEDEELEPESDSETTMIN